MLRLSFLFFLCFSLLQVVSHAQTPPNQANPIPTQWDGWNPKKGTLFYRYTRALPRITKVEISFGHENDNGAFEVESAKVLKGQDMLPFIEVWRSILCGNPSACWSPRHRLRFYVQNKVVLKTVICFECGSLTFNTNDSNLGKGFDVQGKEGKALFQAIQTALQQSKSQK